MEITGNLHRRIMDVIGTEPKVDSLDTAAFDRADDVLANDPTSANLPIGGLLRTGQGLTFGVLVWHGDDHIQAGKTRDRQDPAAVHC
jgi:hypothetical protein